MPKAGNFNVSDPQATVKVVPEKNDSREEKKGEGRKFMRGWVGVP